MRSLVLLAALFSPLALAQVVIDVAPHGVMRLPASVSMLHVERLRIAEHGTLLIPASLSEMRVAELRLGRDARIAIAPADQVFRLEVASGEIASGAQISARGARGTPQQPALPGRALSIRLQAVVAESLLLDARGGSGAPGYTGLDGADGQAGGCTWGQASRGHDGQDGGDGQEGAAGAQVRLELPVDFPAQALQVRLDGGAGGVAGQAGQGGRGGLSKGCWLYSTQGAGDGRPGQAGKAGAAGPSGRVDLLRF
jgi:hypothetical protein